jgi:hypothetical protein
MSLNGLMRTAPPTREKFSFVAYVRKSFLGQRQAASSLTFLEVVKQLFRTQWSWTTVVQSSYRCVARATRRGHAAGRTLLKQSLLGFKVAFSQSCPLKFHSSQNCPLKLHALKAVISSCIPQTTPVPATLSCPPSRPFSRTHS